MAVRRARRRDRHGQRRPVFPTTLIRTGPLERRPHRRRHRRGRLDLHPGGGRFRTGGDNARQHGADRHSRGWARHSGEHPVLSRDRIVRSRPRRLGAPLAVGEHHRAVVGRTGTRLGAAGHCLGNHARCGRVGRCDVRVDGLDPFRVGPCRPGRPTTAGRQIRKSRFGRHQYRAELRTNPRDHQKARSMGAHGICAIRSRRQRDGADRGYRHERGAEVRCWHRPHGRSSRVSQAGCR